MAELAPQLNRSRPRRPRYIVGIELPRDLDGRSSSARRFKRICRSFSEELGSGDLSPVDLELVAQAATMMLRAEQIRSDILTGKATNDDEAIRLASECRRILIRLKGKTAKNKPTGPNLQEYLSTAYQTAGAEAESDQ